MIVLDEQLLGRNIEREIGRWYPGSVRFVTDLRPHSVIKDDAIPALLRRENQPTFLTINETDFWRRIAADDRYCVVCFAIPDSRAGEIPQALRSLLGRPEFAVKARRMGMVIRVADNEIAYYASDQQQIIRIT